MQSRSQSGLGFKARRYQYSLSVAVQPLAGVCADWSAVDPRGDRAHESRTWTRTHTSSIASTTSAFSVTQMITISCEILTVRQVVVRIARGGNMDALPEPWWENSAGAKRAGLERGTRRARLLFPSPLHPDAQESVLNGRYICTSAHDASLC